MRKDPAGITIKSGVSAASLRRMPGTGGSPSRIAVLPSACGVILSASASAFRTSEKSRVISEYLLITSLQARTDFLTERAKTFAQRKCPPGGPVGQYLIIIFFYYRRSPQTRFLGYRVRSAVTTPQKETPGLRNRKVYARHAYHPPPETCGPLADAGPDTLLTAYFPAPPA